MKVKVLSLRQPWAKWIVDGKKKIETRTWRTKYSGLLYIHASKTIDDYACKKYNIDKKELVTGAIIGKVYVEGTKEYKTNAEFFKDKSKHLVTKDLLDKIGWTEKKKFGFILKNPKKIKPRPLKGQLNVFEAEI